VPTAAQQWAAQAVKVSLENTRNTNGRSRADPRSLVAAQSSSYLRRRDRIRTEPFVACQVVASHTTWSGRAELARQKLNSCHARRVGLCAARCVAAVAGDTQVFGGYKRGKW